MRRFQHVLEACGVNKALIKEGVREGDTVIVGEVTCHFSSCYIFYKMIISMKISALYVDYFVKYMLLKFPCLCSCLL